MAAPLYSIALDLLRETAEDAPLAGRLEDACAQAADLLDGVAVVFVRGAGDRGWIRAAAGGLDDGVDRRGLLERARSLTERATLAAGFILEDPGEPAALALPLRVAGRISGCLVLLASREPTGDEVSDWSAVADAMALALAWRAAHEERERLRSALADAECRARDEAVQAAAAELARETAEDLVEVAELLRATLTVTQGGDTAARDLVIRMERGLEALRHLPSTPVTGEPMDVADLVTDVVNAARESFEESGLEIQLRAAADLPRIRINGGLLRQVCVRLLEAARLHAPKKGRVRVDAVREGGEIAVRMVCQSEPVPGAALDTLWSGLAEDDTVPFRAVRSLLERYEGRLESRSEGGVLALRICLPIRGRRERRQGPDRRHAA